jgi:hypothetical protein
MDDFAAVGVQHLAGHFMFAAGWLLLVLRRLGRHIFKAQSSRPIVHGHDTFVVRATGTAVKITLGFDAVADNFATAVFAFGGHCMDGAFKAVEKMRRAVPDDFQQFVVLVTANFTFHSIPPLFIVASRLIARGLNLLVVFRVGHAFIDKFFGERLLIGRRNCRSLLSFRGGDWLPALILRNGLGGGRGRIHFVFTLQFVQGLIEVGIQDVILRAAIDDGDFARALHNHVFRHSAEAFSAVAEPAFFNSILFHESSLSLCIGNLPLLRDID